MGRMILSLSTAICCLYAAGAMARIEGQIKAKQIQQEQTIQQILKEAK